MKWWDADIAGDSFLMTALTVTFVTFIGILVYCLYNLTIGWPLQTWGIIGGVVGVWLFWYVRFYRRR